MIRKEEEKFKEIEELTMPKPPRSTMGPIAM
jgi:hypothetical protein